MSLRLIQAMLTSCALLLGKAAPAEPVPNHYIVVLKDKALLTELLGLPINTPAQRVLDQAQAQLGFSTQQVTYRYRSAFSGFAVAMPEHVARGLNRSGLVAHVEQDQTMRLSNATQSNSVWGLDRLDTRENARDMKYTYTATGANVHAYVVDTGIRASHREFTG